MVTFSEMQLTAIDMAFDRGPLRVAMHTGVSQAVGFYRYASVMMSELCSTLVFS